MLYPPKLTIPTILFAVLFTLMGQPSLSKEGEALRIDQEAQQVANVKPVVLTVTVTNDRGEFVSGLKQESFSVLDEKTPQKISYFNDQDIPVAVGILLDISASMSWQGGDAIKLRILQDALARFMELSNPLNEYFFVTFNETPRVLQDWTTDASALLHKLSSVQSKGQTAFLDACYLGLDKIAHGRFSKQALIVISDGENTDSHRTHGEVKRLLKE